MNIGYPCLCLGVDGTSFRTCIKKFATEDLLTELIAHNLATLSRVLQYNHEQGIQLFRIGSDLIPFGSSEINPLPWQTMFQEELQALGRQVLAYGMRVSMHPGQYTLLNALDKEIVKRSILDLEYHCSVLDGMQLNATHKLILHVGGIYKDKASAIQRFVQVYETLSDAVKRRLVIENDDRYYSLEDVMYLSNMLQIPVIFDNLHHLLLPSFPSLSQRACMELVSTTWKKEDGAMKLHYSQQDLARRSGAHAPYLRGMEFLDFIKEVPEGIDIMIEIKDKNLSALQALYLLGQREFHALEVWEHYQFLVLRHCSVAYTSIAASLEHLGAAQFFWEIQKALEVPRTMEQALICYEQMRREYEPHLSQKHRTACERALQKFQKQMVSETAVCACFYRAALSIQRGSDYLFLHV